MLLAGCGGGNSQPASNSQGGGDQAKPNFKVAMVTDTGGVNDNSFNQSAWEGLQKVGKELGLKKPNGINYSESKSEADYVPNLNNFVKEKWDLTWAIGFAMAESVTKVAKENPDAKIAIIDSDLGGKIPSNVAAVTYKEQEGSFLMGVLAGLTTKTNKIGFLGGMEVPLIQKFEYGFKAGVYAVNPKAEVTAVYAGSFGQPDKGKTLAATLYQRGADVIYHAAGGTGDGLFKEAKERGKGFWAIGVDRDQAYLAPDNTLSSMVKRVDTAVYTVSKDLANKTWKGGSQVELGLKDDGIAMGKFHESVSADTKAKIEDYKKKLISGEIVAPETKEKFEAFKAKK